MILVVAAAAVAICHHSYVSEGNSVCEWAHFNLYNEENLPHIYGVKQLSHEQGGSKYALTYDSVISCPTIKTLENEINQQTKPVKPFVSGCNGSRVDDNDNSQVYCERMDESVEF